MDALWKDGGMEFLEQNVLPAHQVSAWHTGAAIVPLKNIHCKKACARFSYIPTTLHIQRFGCLLGEKWKSELHLNCAILQNSTVVINRKSRQYFISIFQPALICSLSGAALQKAVLSSYYG